jgi:transcriptional regulator with GAF, ATPase, and Fis domain
LLQLISSGAAISIENARLYHEMKQEAAQRRQAEETLRSIVEGTAAVTGSNFFSALVRHLAAVMGVRYAFVTECTDQARTRVKTLAFWAGESLGDNFEYDLALTPCEAVIGGQVCHHPSRLRRLFPGDKDLATLGAESFIGLPMCNDSGEIIGHLAVLDSRPMPDVSATMPLLKTFAARAGAELQRLKAEQELRQALTEVESLKNRLHAENVYLQEEIRREHNFEEIVGNSPALLEVLGQVQRVAPTDSTVLVYGETGTGKELIARAIHDRSDRKRHPLVKVNCGAISAGLVESELFGHVKGAFTGAIDRRIGRFELANGGTLFLDEVSELPLETQVKLLRVLQEGEFEPVGSNKTVRVDVRIIAATNRNLEEAVQQGRFRSDLFYRLNVFPLKVPPLRERTADIAQLVMFFLGRYSKKLGRQIDSVSQETMERLLSYSWPGNVRELQNIIERGVVVSTGSVLTLGPDFVPASLQTVRTATPVPTTVGARDERLALQDVERQHILAVLIESRWIIEGEKGAARILKLHPNTLRSRMKKLGIVRPSHEIS